MSEKKEYLDTGGFAFPRVLPDVEMSLDEAVETIKRYAGMTLRQYAAIKLRVPNSGTDWLDEMIRESLRDEFSAKAMQACAGLEGWFSGKPDHDVKHCVVIADAMLAARSKVGGQ